MVETNSLHCLEAGVVVIALEITEKRTFFPNVRRYQIIETKSQETFHICLDENVYSQTINPFRFWCLDSNAPPV